MNGINSNYEQHVKIAKNLKMADSFYEAREPYKEAFEELYQKAKDENVSMSNAKEFLNSLAKEELSTLQNYTLLADEIDVNSLNDEGAYNLLLHHYEKYDFDNDGVIQDGIAKTSSLIPVNMPDTEKQAFVNALNEMDEKDRFNVISITLLSNMTIDGITTTSDDNEFDYNAILEKIDRVLNPLPGEVRSEELLSSFNIFKELFQKKYEELNEQKESLNSNMYTNSELTKALINNKV